MKFNRNTLSLEAVSEIATNCAAGATDTTSKNKLFSFNKVSKLLGGLLLALPLTGISTAYASNSLTGATVINGKVDIVTKDLVTTITNSNGAIIEWEKFNIKSNELVKFIQESSNSAVLNRVLGGSVSQILGTLESNGKVFIVNPAGIVFGANSVVNVQSLVASTLDISNEDFVKGNYVFNQEKDQAIASVLSQGLIKVNDDGTLALVGGQVVNTGVLEAKNGTVYLLAGQSITIQDLDNPLISYKVTAENKAVNLGEIVSKRAYLLANKVAVGYTSAEQFADVISTSDSARKASITANGEVLLYGASESDLVQQTNFTDAQLAANISNQSGLVVINGTINASNATGTGGTVTVLGDVVGLESSALVNASGNQGGQVYLGGDEKGKGEKKLSSNTIVVNGAQVNVSGTNANAGQAIAWGNTAYYDGTFYATSVNGNGGLVETSAKQLNLLDNLYVDTRSVNGNVGTWLLDPTSIYVINDTPDWSDLNTQTGGSYSDSDLCTTSTSNYKARDNKGNDITFIKASVINTSLQTSNVTLEANNSIWFYFLNDELNSTSNYNLNVNAKYVNIHHSNITLAGNLFIYNSSSKAGDTFNITNSNVTVERLWYSGKGDVKIVNSTTNSTTFWTSLRTTCGSITVDNSSLVAANPVTLYAEVAVTLNNTYINASGYNVSINGKAGVTLNNTYIDASGNNLSIYTPSCSTLNINQDLTSLDTTKNTFIGNNVSLSGGTVNVHNITINSITTTSISSSCATSGVNASNINVSARNFSIRGSELNFNNSKVENTSGYLSVTTNKSANLDKINFSNVACVTFTFRDANVNITNSNFSGNKDVTGNITFENDASSRTNLSTINLTNVNIDNFNQFTTYQRYNATTNVSINSVNVTDVKDINFAATNLTNFSTGKKINVSADGFNVNITGTYTDNSLVNNYNNVTIDAGNYIRIGTANYNSSSFSNSTFNGTNVTLGASFYDRNVNYDEKVFTLTQGINLLNKEVSHFSNLSINAKENANFIWIGTATNISNVSINSTKSTFILLTAFNTTDSNNNPIVTAIDKFNVNSDEGSINLGFRDSTVNTEPTTITLKNLNFTANKQAHDNGTSASNGITISSSNQDYNAKGTTATDASIHIVDSKLKSSGDSVTVTTKNQGAITVTNSTLEAYSYVLLCTSSNQHINVIDSNLTSCATKAFWPTSPVDVIRLHSSGDVNVSNSNLTAGLYINLTTNGTGSTLNLVNGSSITSGTDVNIFSNRTNATDINLSNVKVNATQQLNIYSTTGDVKVADSNLSTETNYSTIYLSSGDFNVNNSNFTARGFIFNSTAPEGKVAEFENVNVKVGDLFTTLMVANNNTLKVNASNFTGNGYVNFTGNNANVEITNTNISATNTRYNTITLGDNLTNKFVIQNSTVCSTYGDVRLTAKDSIVTNNSNYATGDDFVFNVTNGTFSLLDNSNKFTIGDNLTIYGNQGVELADLEITAGNSANITSKGQTNLSNATVNAKNNVNTSGVTVNLNKQSKLNAGANARVNGTNVNIDNSTVTGAVDVRVNGTEVNLTNSTQVTATNGTDVRANTLNIKENTTVSAGNSTYICATLLNVDNATISTTSTTCSTANITIRTNTANFSNHAKVLSNSVYINSNYVNVDNATLTSTTGYTNVSAPNISLSNSANVSGEQVNISSTNVTLNTASNLGATNRLDVNTTNLSIDNATVGDVAGDTRLCITNDLIVTGEQAILTGNIVRGVINNNLTVNAGAIVGAVDYFTLNASKGNVTIDKGNVGLKYSTRTHYIYGTNISLVNGSQVQGYGIHLCATNNLDFNASTVDVSSGATLRGYVNLTVKDAPKISGYYVDLNASNGQTSIDNSSIQSTSSSVVIRGKDLVSLNNSKVESTTATSVRATTINVAKSEIKANEREISLGDANTTSTNVIDTNLTTTGSNTDINLRGNENVNTTNVKVDSSRDINLSSPTGTVTLNNTSLTAVRSINLTAPTVNLADKVVVTTANIGIATTNFTATSGAKFNASENFTLVAEKEIVTTNLEVNSNRANLQGANVTLTGGTINGTNGVAVTASNNLNTNGTTLTSAEGNTNLAGNNLSVTGGAVKGASVSLVANETTTVNATSLTSTADAYGKVTVKGKTATLDNATITTTPDSKAQVNLIGQEGEVKVTNSTATNGKLNITASSVTLTNSSFTGDAGEAAVINATTGSVDLNATNVTNFAQTTITAEKGNITLENNSNVESGSDLSLKSGDQLTVKESSVTSTAQTGNVTLTSPNKTTLDKAVVKGSGKVEVSTTSGDTTVTDTTLESANDNVSVSGANVVVAGGKASGTNVSVTASEKVDVNNISLTSTATKDGQVVV
ncbi:hypothetical protein CJP74_00970, partial [Psittacicella melopsittaci]